MKVMARDLSSSMTFAYKFVFLITWIGMFAFGMVILFLKPDSSWRDYRGPGDPHQMKWLFLFATLAGTAFLWWGCIRLKRVRMDDRALYVSNYFKEIAVPLNDVASVTENRWINIHPVTIVFHAETDFGHKVVFMPGFRLLNFLSHPVVKEIREAVDRHTVQRY